MRRRLAILALLALFLSSTAFGERWALQYFYDETYDKLEIVDLAFPTAQRGVAVGWIGDVTSERKVKPIALLTKDGGAHWTRELLRDQPRSIFFLNENSGWMVTDTAIWATTEAGLNWRRISEQPRPNKKLGPETPGGLILRVWFVDEHHGFAIGYQKTVLETRDGGKSWKPVADAAEPTGNPAYTAYSQIVFDGKYGLIVGSAVPPRRSLGPFPSWMDPERATKQPAAPNVTLLLQTNDQGATWKAANVSLLGLASAIRLSGTAGLSVFSYPESFEYPSEVFRLNLNDGSSTSSFRAKDRKVFDAALFPGPNAVLAAVEPPGKLNSIPIPGKVRMLSSDDLMSWKQMDVDYRAVATTLVLAGPDREHLWVATDTGMILHLEP